MQAKEQFIGRHFGITYIAIQSQFELVINALGMN